MNRTCDLRFRNPLVRTCVRPAQCRSASREREFLPKLSQFPVTPTLHPRAGETDGRSYEAHASRGTGVQHPGSPILRPRKAPVGRALVRRRPATAPCSPKKPPTQSTAMTTTAATKPSRPARPGRADNGSVRPSNTVTSASRHTAGTPWCTAIVHLGVLDIDTLAVLSIDVVNSLGVGSETGV